ncbi:MAG: alkaline phosphatase family protein [Erysipelotrichaceae bacterium]|nr:alkaline phosphatase family protein [Erysipelotrichaceae bacterium]
MKVRNDYRHCLTNMSNSIRKYFSLKTYHNSLPVLDDILERRKPKNVVMFLLDGMGNNILNRVMDPDCFLNTHRRDVLTSVFPATTTAATTSIITGNTPAEHGWLGWNTYIPKIGKTITMFREFEKGSSDKCAEFVEIENSVYHLNDITEEIKANGEFAVKLYPFGADPYEDLDDMLSRVEELCSKPGRKFIYAYDDEPDGTMHQLGADSPEVKELIQERNDKISKLCEKLTDTVVIIVADHGHVTVENIWLTEYPQIMELLERTTSIEPRAVSFKIREGCHQKFQQLFNENFGQWFTLYPAKEIVESQLFGDGEMHPDFVEELGDYLAIADKGNRCLLTEGDHALFSQHAGYLDDEIFVPLIVVEK